MTSWFLAAIIAISTALSWRLISVIVDSTDDKHREIARKTLTTIWGTSILGTGTTTTIVRLYELGILQ